MKSNYLNHKHPGIKIKKSNKSPFTVITIKLNHQFKGGRK